MKRVQPGTVSVVCGLGWCDVFASGFSASSASLRRRAVSTHPGRETDPPADPLSHSASAGVRNRRGEDIHDHTISAASQKVRRAAARRSRPRRRGLDGVLSGQRSSGVDGRPGGSGGHASRGSPGRKGKVAPLSAARSRVAPEGRARSGLRQRARRDMTGRNAAPVPF